MTTTTYTEPAACVPRAGTLYDVIEIILDRGMVIDVFLRVSLVGIEILKVDVRIVIASVDTYLRFAEACNRIDLETDTRSRTVPELFGGGSMAGAGAKKAAKSVGGKVMEAIGAGDEDEDEDEDEEEEEESSRSRPRRRSTATTSGGRSRARSTRRSREG